MKYLILIVLLVGSCEKEPLLQPCQHLSCRAYYIRSPDTKTISGDTLFFSTTSCDLPAIEETFDGNIKCDCENIP